MRWEAGADELSIPQTKIRVSGYFLLLNCMALSKYPFFVKSNTKKWFLSFFRLSRPKFFVYWFWLGQANNSKIFTCLYSAVACDWSGARRHVLKACVWSTHAFKTNKQNILKFVSSGSSSHSVLLNHLNEIGSTWKYIYLCKSRQFWDHKWI